MVERAVEMNGQVLGSPRKRVKRDPVSKVTVVLGAQWGDEGKGKVVDMLATEVDIVCRCQMRYRCVFRHLAALWEQNVAQDIPCRLSTRHNCDEMM
uniref:Adenylosuccinate synthetase n=1 Tax=Timema californicum TaxID=61474 RepID=A0A7R9P361_TIMCA|nr:unnamed protein product [Timema californicum]